MKRTLLTLLSILFCAITFAQSVPQGINYQAVARDASGAVLMNHALTIQLSVIADIADTTNTAISWQETHQDTTNAYGLFTAIIGNGTTTGLGFSATFDSINWGASNHLLKVEIDYGGGLLDMGTTAFMSVPYALKSGSSTDNYWQADTTGYLQNINSNNVTIEGNLTAANTPLIEYIRYDNNNFNSNTVTPSITGSWQTIAQIYPISPLNSQVDTRAAYAIFEIVDRSNNDGNYYNFQDNITCMISFFNGEVTLNVLSSNPYGNSIGASQIGYIGNIRLQCGKHILGGGTLPSANLQIKRFCDEPGAGTTDVRVRMYHNFQPILMPREFTPFVLTSNSLSLTNITNTEFDVLNYATGFVSSSTKRQYVDKSTMGNLNVNSNIVTTATLPFLDSHLTRKDYVDTGDAIATAKIDSLESVISTLDSTLNSISLSISGDTLFISSGNSIVIPGLSLINSLIVQGCTDSTATNYNSSANTDDGSCAPTITSGTTGTNLVENTGAGQTVYTITADANYGGTISSYAIGGTDAGLLTLTGNVVTLNADPDYETKSSYSFTVTATDAAGTSAATPVTFSITNVDDIDPTITSGFTGTDLVENTGAGQTVYTITADANDGGTISSYDISGTDAALLAVNASTGVVTLTADPDYETKSSYSFTVTASDAAGTSDPTTVTFSINNVDEVAPTMTITATEVNNNDTSNDPSLNLIFTSSESTSNFVVGDIAVAGGTLSAFSGSGTTYTATFTPAAAGACTIDVLASAFTDAAGNNNTAADQFNWTYNSGYSKLRINDLTDLSNNFFYQNGYDNAGNTTSSSYMYYYIWVDATGTTASAGRANSASVRVGSWASGWNAGQNSVISNYIQNITMAGNSGASGTNYGNVNWQITTTNPSSDYIEIELKNGGYFDGTEVIHVWLDDTGSNNPDYGYDGRGTNTPLPGPSGIFSPWTSYITFIP
jgi:hypothetical protein